MKKQEAMKESMQRWKEERERNAEYIEVMRRAKEERKKEIEAQENALLQMKEEAEPEPRILAQDTGGVTRPWLAHINIQKDSGEPVECTGSLLNL